VRYALKEAKRQNLVLTNRNDIRGIFTWASKHIIVKPKEKQKSRYVDVAVIRGRKKLLPGEVLEVDNPRSQQRS